MTRKTIRSKTGHDEVADIRRRETGPFVMVFLLSVCVNILMLTGPIYMLQVYDSVLGSGSVETLLALSIIVTFLFVMMGVLDHIRGRIMARVSARFQSGLEFRVFTAYLKRSAGTSKGAVTRNSLRDVQNVQRLLSSPVFLALFDLPWTPLFVAAIFLFHPWLGYLAVTGGLVLVAVALANQALAAGPLARTGAAAARADKVASSLVANAELVQSLGMRGAAFARWMTARRETLVQTISHSDRSGLFTVTTKTLRLYLQSAMLGMGAYLVLQGEMTAGAMIAGSILLGRSLAPIETVVGQWKVVLEAKQARAGIVDLLDEIDPDATLTALPVPNGLLVVDNLTILPPGMERPVLSRISFRLEPGTAMGVIGKSGSGKTSLARAITGAIKPLRGRVLLDGARLDQYDPDVLGSHIGYLPQNVTLFDGTIGENIARLSVDANPARIVHAAKQAAAHEMILAQPEGYDTQVSSIGGRLSGGQIQRIGLARAMYGDPVILVLDEPNSNLDAEGTEALNAAIADMKSRSGSVVIIAHRPAAIRECETLLVISDGEMTAFGERDDVLRRVVKNHSDLTPASDLNARSDVPLEPVGA